MTEYVKKSVVEEYLKRAIFGADRKIDEWVDQMPAADVLENGRIESGVFEALRILDAINGTGRMDYGDYCDLHDAICSIMDGGDAG